MTATCPRWRPGCRSSGSRSSSSTYADIEARQTKLEADLAQLEAAGAKARAAQGTPGPGGAASCGAQRELDGLDESNRFRNLKVQDLEGDELLYRQMRDRYGRYFRGGIGTQAESRSGCASFDLEGEAQSLRDIIRTGKGQRKARALKRRSACRRSCSPPGTARWAWCWTASR